MEDKTHLESKGVTKMCRTARTHKPAMFILELSRVAQRTAELGGEAK